MVVDAAVRLNKPHDALLIEIVKSVNPPPCGESDARVRLWLGGQNDLFRIAGDDSGQFGNEIVTIPATVLYHYAAIFQVVHLYLVRNGLEVQAPAGDPGDVWARRRWPSIVGGSAAGVFTQAGCHTLHRSRGTR
jgi:hypothetical protein